MDSGPIRHVEAALRGRLLAIEAAPSHTETNTPDSQARAQFERALAGTAHDARGHAAPSRQPAPGPQAPAAPEAPTVNLSQAAVAASRNPHGTLISPATVSALLRGAADDGADGAAAEGDPHVPVEVRASPGQPALRGESADIAAAVRADTQPHAGLRPDLAASPLNFATAASTKLAPAQQVEAPTSAELASADLIARMLANREPTPGASYLNWVMVVSALAGVLILVLL